MKLSQSLLALATAAGLLVAGPALSAGKSVGVIDHDWSFEGPFGTFDRQQLQRGWQVYSEICASCHSMDYLSFRNLGEPGGPEFPPEQVKAIAENWLYPVVTTDDEGEVLERTPLPSDRIPGPFANREAAIAANGGAYPPDLSLITKARIGYNGIIKQVMEGAGGPEYVYSLLLGYADEEPEGFDGGGLSYNRYFPGHRIAMGQPLYGDDVEYQDGTEATIEQHAADLVAFLTWAAEPKMEERKEAGVRNIILLALFAVLLWYSNKTLWRPIKDGGQA
ncbi:MAG: cytochrome c1 [Neomegalonema sp.]